MYCMLIYGTQSVLKLWTICHVTELDLNYHSKLIYEGYEVDEQRGALSTMTNLD